MNEVEELADALITASDVWFTGALHTKLLRLIEIARRGQQAQSQLRDVEMTLEQERLHLAEADDLLHGAWPPAQTK